MYEIKRLGGVWITLFTRLGAKAICSHVLNFKQIVSLETLIPSSNPCELLYITTYTTLRVIKKQIKLKVRRICTKFMNLKLQYYFR